MTYLTRLAMLSAVLGGSLLSGAALAQQAVAPVAPMAPRSSPPGLPPTPASAAAVPKAAPPKQTAATEAPQHPRIVRAVRDLEDAIKYMEAAPHNFGGHKAKAIQDSKAAAAQLREALKYRAEQDSKGAGTPVATKAAAPKVQPAAGSIPAGAAPVQTRPAPQLPSATAPAQPTQYPRTPLAPNMQQ